MDELDEFCTPDELKIDRKSISIRNPNFLDDFSNLSKAQNLHLLNYICLYPRVPLHGSSSICQLWFQEL